MEYITVENIDKAIEKVLASPLNCDNLEKFVLLNRAKKYLRRMHKEFTEEDAMNWARGMNPPARWTMDQTTDVMHQFGYHHKPCEFYIVMNSLYSDYGKTVVQYGVDQPGFWASLAHDWLSDKDAVEYKLEAYYRDIVKHY